MQVLVCMSLGAGLLQTIDTWVGWFDLTAEGVVMLKELRLLAYFYWFGIASTSRHDRLARALLLLPAGFTAGSLFCLIWLPHHARR